MPWMKIGRFSFDLAEVVLVADGIPAEREEPGITVSLACGKEVDLIGEEARVFEQAFAAFVASRQFDRGPPGEFIEESLEPDPRREAGANNGGPGRR